MANYQGSKAWGNESEGSIMSEIDSDERFSLSASNRRLAIDLGIPKSDLLRMREIASLEAVYAVDCYPAGMSDEQLALKMLTHEEKILGSLINEWQRAYGN